MFLGSTRCAAHAVTARTAAQQYDDVAGSRSLTDDGIPGSRADDAAHFHALCYKAGMIIFFYAARCQADLVAVGAVACSSAQSNLPLGQFALQGLFIRRTGIGSTGDTHSLIYIAAAAEGIADGATQAGSCAAERFDFRRMVMGFVLEHHQPVFFFTVNGDGHYDAAGIDFFRSIQVRDLAFLLQLLRGQAGHIHQRNGPLRIRTVHEVPVMLIQGESLSYRICIDAICNGDIFQLRFKRGMAAVVGPVCIQHLDFRNGGIPVFLLEIILDEGQIVDAHSQFLLVQEILQACMVQFPEARQDGHRFRHIPGHVQGFRLFNGRFLGFHRVDDIVFDLFYIFCRQFTFQHIHLCRGDDRALALGDSLDTLGSEIFPLVILAGQQFHSKAMGAFRNGHGFFIHFIHRGFTEHQGLGGRVFFIAEARQVVAVQDPDTGKPGQAQRLFQVAAHIGSFYPIGFFLFHIDSSDVLAHDSLPQKYSLMKLFSFGNIFSSTSLAFSSAINSMPACSSSSTE